MTTLGDREVTADRWRRLQALYHEMLARPVEERAAALAAAYTGDPELAAEVQALLDQPESSAGPLDKPAAEMAARFVSPVGSPLIGRRIGVFEIQALLGVGGMGEVSAPFINERPAAPGCEGTTGCLGRSLSAEAR